MAQCYCGTWFKSYPTGKKEEAQFEDLCPKCRSVTSSLNDNYTEREYTLGHLTSQVFPNPHDGG